MEIKQGYTYHIKDSYFELVQDSNLMQNREFGKYRPTFFCLRDEKLDLLWMIPISSKYEKAAAIREKLISNGKPCRGIVLGEFDGRQAAFLIQNMFPIREEYIDHIHTKNGNPVPVSQKIQKEIRKNVKKLLALNAKGNVVTFTEINRLKEIMLSNSPS